MVNHLSFIILACVILATLACLWLVFMICFPRQWSALVDKENAFWVERGLVSSPRAEQIKRLEKGIAVKLMAGLLLALAIFLLAVSLHFQGRIHPQRKWPMLPPFRPGFAPSNSRPSSIRQ